MTWTRRDFLRTTGVVAGAATLTPAGAWPAAPAAPPLPVDPPAFLQGDPYLAAVVEPGLGGGTFDAMRDQALRFRTPPALRDDLVLGWGTPRA
ncbi:MAG: twin-arginine translocation signal domain-containing protein [Acidobacteria bacterium]|nr:twin-arginine translocation signal domain-containing protein [Acidobacteriota bacterium]